MKGEKERRQEGGAVDELSHCVACAVLITGRIKKVRTDLVNIKISWRSYNAADSKETVSLHTQAPQYK